MKSVHLLVDFLVEVPDDEKETDELFINFPEPVSNYQVLKYNQDGKLTVAGQVLEYETIDKEDLA